MARIIGDEYKSCKRCANFMFDEALYDKDREESGWRCKYGLNCNEISDAITRNIAMGKKPSEIGTICEKYEAKFLDFPIEVETMELPESYSQDKKDRFIAKTSDTGKIADVWLIDDTGKKPLTGIVIGECAGQAGVVYNKSTQRLRIYTDLNPLIYIPSQEQFVYGVECYWRLRDDAANAFDLPES